MRRSDLGAAVSAAMMALAAPAAPAGAEDAVKLDEISVTATREERPTKEVPQSITVVGQEKIDAQVMMNVKDALSGEPGVLIDSRNGGYDARLVLRGAGLKARYGVREIMVLRDGVPMTDPDSFTRLDFIDTQDIEQIEVVKGPGSIYATGSAGGAIHILSKSVFDEENRLKFGVGQFGTISAHGRVGGMIGEGQALSLSASHRRSDSDWRRWNEFDTSQASLKHGVFLGDGLLESEVSYSQADMQLPGSMDAGMFRDFRRTGRQTESQGPWQHSGRYSKIAFGNMRYEQEFGDFVFKPRVYATYWEHYHPVTGFINDSDGNYVVGTDIEGAYKHSLLGMPSSLVAGLTLRHDMSFDARKYTYGDVETERVFVRGRFVDRVVRTLSDRRGDLAETSDTTNTVYGVFAQESVEMTESLRLDAGFRLDRSEFTIDSDERIAFDYGTGAYVPGAGESRVEAGFLLFSPKVGLSYAITPAVSLYGSVAQAGQVPSTSELDSNPDLDNAVSTNFEVGVKARFDKLHVDAALYYNPVRNEIIAQLQDSRTTYQNAGRTSKKGFELSVGYQLLPGLTIGGGYAYSDFTFDEFSEIVYGPGGPVDISRAGKQLPFVPRHQYSIHAAYQHASGFRARVQTEGWGEYYMDNANTERYGGYDFVTDLMIGWEYERHLLSLNVENVFDQRYAVEVTKGLDGEKSYHAASPRLIMATYRLKF